MDVTVVGIDIGTTNTKAVLVGDDATRPSTIATRPTPGSGAALIDTATEVVRAVLHDGHPPAAIGIASMAETGTVLLDDAPVGGLLRWQGRRAELEPDRDRYRATGVPFPGKTPIAMLEERQAERALPAGARWAGVSDLVGFVLTGMLATDLTLAARTGGYRRSPRGEAPATRFDPDLVAATGMGPEAFPEVMVPCRPLGRVTRAAADRFGVPVGIPVVLAGHDHAVAAWAAGVRSPGDRADSLGTTEAIYAISSGEPDVDLAHGAGASITPTPENGRVAVLAANPTAGAVLEWFAAVRRRDLDELDASAAALALTCRDLVFRPDLRGRQSPVPDPDARIAITTTSGRPARLPADDAESLAVVARGLALQARWLHDTIDAIAGPAAGPVTVIPGPLTRSFSWQAAREAVLDRASRLCTVDAAVAVAAALRAAVVTGLAAPGTTFPTEPHRSPRPAGDAGRWYDAFRETARGHPLHT